MQTLVEYLRRNIMGRPMYTGELVYSLEDGALEGVYSDQMTFSGLESSSGGMKFDLFVASREKIHEMDADGKRGSLRKDFSGLSHFRYELALRKSSGEITGHMRYVGGTLNPAPAEAMASAVTGFRFKGGEVRWQEQEMIYRDQPGPGGALRPVAFVADCRFYFEEDRLCYEYDGVCMDVDPKTGLRTTSTAAFPKFVAKERIARARDWDDSHD